MNRKSKWSLYAKTGLSAAKAASRLLGAFMDLRFAKRRAVHGFEQGLLSKGVPLDLAQELCDLYPDIRLQTLGSGNGSFAGATPFHCPDRRQAGYRVEKGATCGERVRCALPGQTMASIRNKKESPSEEGDTVGRD